MARIGPREKLFLLLSLLGSLTVTAGLAEIALRIADYPRAFRIPKQDSGPVFSLVHRKATTSGLVYELKRTDEFPYRTSPLGLRDTLSSIRKPPGVRRIVCLGDSFTWGFEVGHMDPYPRRLQHHLRNSPSDWQVVNMGVGGYASRDEAVVLRCRVPEFEPDVVIVGYALNDPEADAIHELRNFFADHPWWHHVHLFRLAVGAHRRLMKKWHGGYIATLHRNPKHWNTVVEAFGSMRETADSLDAFLLLVIFPVTPRGGTEAWNHYRHEWVHEQVADEARKHDIAVLDLLPEFRQFDADTIRVSPTDGHPSRFAHDLAARRIAEKLSSEFGVR